MDTHVLADAPAPRKPIAPLEPRHLGLIEMAEVARVFQMSRMTLDRIADDPGRHFPKRVKLGKRLFVNEQALRRWIDSQTSSVEAA